jgi:hypothetical protein
MVSSQFADYRDSFLFSLTLHFGLQVWTLDLNERGAEASFVLAQRYAEGAAAEKFQEVGGEVPDEPSFAWEEPEVQLPQDLEHLWTRSSTGTKRLDLKSFLEQLPRWSVLPSKPKVNNYRGGHHRSLDKHL